MDTKQPPFDGKLCPMCAIEIRNLHAVAHNYLNALKGGLTEKASRKLDALKRAVEATQPLIDAHFKHRMHSHGEWYDNLATDLQLKETTK